MCWLEFLIGCIIAWIRNLHSFLISYFSMIQLKFPKFRPIFLIIILIFLGALLREYFIHQPPEVLAPTLEELIVDSGVDNESMPAIDEPVFESVPSADAYLQNDGQGLVLIKNGQAKFYPFQILVWHNLVSDVWNGFPILVAYDPLCGSARVFERDTNEATVLEFKNSGQIYNSNLLFVDKGTDSLWSSLTGEAITGSKIGQTLTPIPSLIMVWQNFKVNFPNGSVLSRETGVSRDYSKNPYGNYAETPEIRFPLTKMDASLPAKTFVFGYSSVVYPEDNIKSSKSIDSVVDGRKIRMLWDDDLEAVRGFELEADESLGEEIALVPAYWFCWVGRVFGF